MRAKNINFERGKDVKKAMNVGAYKDIPSWSPEFLDNLKIDWVQHSPVFEAWNEVNDALHESGFYTIDDYYEHLEEYDPIYTINDAIVDLKDKIYEFSKMYVIQEESRQEMMKELYYRLII